MKRILLSMTFILGISAHISAQNLSFYGVLPVWNQTGRISKKINYNLFISSTFDAFERKIDNVNYPANDMQFYFQPSIIYAFSQKFNVAGSYVYQRSNPINNNYVNENRLWQQMIYSHALNKGRMTHRLRFEERFIENRETNKAPLSTRLRYQIGFNMPLQGRTLDVKEFYLNTYNECYFSLTGTKNATYSENWSYAGIGYNLGNAGKLELGYLLQISARNTQQDLRFLDLAQVMWSTNFNFKKKVKK